MTMNMYIVIVMNIYINKLNTERLEKEPNKSGLINQLLERHYSIGENVPEKNISLADANIVEVSKALREAPVPTADRSGIDDKGNIFTASTPVGPNLFFDEFNEAKEAGKRDVPKCCTLKNPCKHWQNDSDREGYVNTFTGGFREYEV